MKKILFLPFLKLSSGHHQAADSLIASIQLIDPSIYCEKVDLLEYSYGKMEAAVSGFYLKWIQHSPKTYNWIYKKTICNPYDQQIRFRIHEMLFENNMLRMIIEKQPDLIVCTHSTPSYLTNRLKYLGLISIPLMNVYTDYFINNVWGLHEVDFHLAPDQKLRQWLIGKGVKKERIFVTGIPVHPQITMSSFQPFPVKSKINFLITGGSLGAGVIKSLLEKSNPTRDQFHYTVLCGKNDHLYSFLLKQNAPCITPLQYVVSRKEMNEIYDQTDVIVTKPGGVTISESLHKSKPIFVYHALPGQEEMNLQHLKQQGLAIHLENWNRSDRLFDEEIINILQSKNIMAQLQHNIVQYHSPTFRDDLNTALQNIINL